MLVCFIAIVFVSGYHEKMFVHCDIKPSNLYINDRFEMTSDSGSLMEIGGEKQEFIVYNEYTPGYASFEHVKAKKENKPRSKD